MAKVKFNSNFDVNRVVKRIVYTVLALYVGGTILTTFGSVMNCTSSPFYNGVSLIGWTITDLTINGSSYTGACNGAPIDTGASITVSNVITNVSGAGVLAVVGIIAIASVVLEFVSWK